MYLKTSAMTCVYYVSYHVTCNFILHITEGHITGNPYCLAFSLFLFSLLIYDLKLTPCLEWVFIIVTKCKF